MGTSVVPSLCLNMIVKNESPIITRLLISVLPLIDTYCICDTGSTDDTISVIKTFFDSHNISGKIVSEPFRDFGYNRTFSIKQCNGLPNSDYLLLMDADMILKIPDSLSITEFKSSLVSNAYYMYQGSPNFFYKNIRIVKNVKDISYVGVTHEYVNVPSGSIIDNIPMTQLFINDVGDGGSKKEKYNRDIRLLTQGLTDDPTNVRYIFYLANSYKDSGNYEDAIIRYKKTLDSNNWNQEKYISCLNIYHCYNALNQQERGIFYLVKSFAYDRERAECLYELVSYYCANNMNEIAYGYYSIVKSFYENTFLTSNLHDKLFLDATKANLFLPYYMIIVADKVKDIQTGILMYRIIFTKKHIETSKFFIGNMLYNLQFFIDTVKTDADFLKLFKEYIDFLLSINYPVYEHDFMTQYAKYGISNNHRHISNFSKKECSTSNKILIYTGFADKRWNDTYMSHHSLGGSEKAVAYLSRYLPKNYEIYISGEVEDEVVGNITYIHRFKLQPLLDKEMFHTIIVSRYLSFFLLYPKFSCHQLFLSAHDTIFLNNLINSDVSVDNIISKWNHEIDGVVCLTKWHKNNIVENYPILQNKMHIINNGILTDSFPKRPTKIKNKFIWTSCSERGLDTLLNLWEDILKRMPDATLDISSYNEFPKNVEDNNMLDIINKHNSIVHHGRLNAEQLYKLMSTCEYWLYTTNFCETSCITALEMLMSEVICLYYPLAGLVDTLGEYGIQVESGNEINTVLNLTEIHKINLRKKGKEYALSCSWENRANEWNRILGLKDINVKPRIGIFNSFPFHYEMFGFILNYANNNKYDVDIFTNQTNNMGWIDYYKDLFENFNVIDCNQFDGIASKYKYYFLTTDDDPAFKPEWIYDNVICINHYYKIRTPNFKHYLNIANFKESQLQYVYPCYPVINYKNKLQSTTVCIVGGGNYNNASIVNRLHSIHKIRLIVFDKNFNNTSLLDRIDKSNIDVQLIEDADTREMISTLTASSYLLMNAGVNGDHHSGISSSGSIQLALSCLSKLIVSSASNKYLQLKNVLEYDIDSNEPINIDAETDFNAIEDEMRDNVDQFEKYLHKSLTNEIQTICILYQIPIEEHIKIKTWNDGFYSAIQLLIQNKMFDIDFINICEQPNINFNKYNLVLMKEGFDGNIIRNYRDKLKHNKLGLFISSSNVVPSQDQLNTYDIIFYETNWYYNYAKLDRHPYCFHAFGINADVMKPINCDKIYDNIFVGAIIYHNNPLKMLTKTGNNLCIGNIIDTEICNQLKSNQINVEEYVDYVSLSNKYNQSKNCFVPCTLHGGGERAVLEARACNINVEIDCHNEKLTELLTSPIYDQNYYYSQILLGICKLFNKQFKRTKINLLYHKDKGHGNFGDELSKYIIDNLINKEKYELIFNSDTKTNINIIGIGSYIQCAPNNCFIYGSGIRTNPPIEYNAHQYSNLLVKSVRGPLTKDFLLKKNINVPLIYGDPALLLPLFYTPNNIEYCNNKIGVIPHISNYDIYKQKTLPPEYILICPYDKWENIIDLIYSCKYIISSAMHGLICSDAYNKPNLWLNEYPLNEGDFKFKDYFLSQNRDYLCISRLEDYDESKLYTKGNIIDLVKLKNAFHLI
jgi:tetratricopeptide (TPR) repeat protein